MLFLVPEDRRIAQRHPDPADQAGRAKPGQVVTVELVAQPSKHAQPIGRVVEVLGNYADPGMEIEIALRKFDLPHEFSQQGAGAGARDARRGARRRTSKGREDLRDLPFVTIDGETAKDFDDAVHAEREGKGFRLRVAIADVSHYVRPGDALDADARERGTSVYFPRRVIPMLPEKLSNGLCSLNPNVDRLAMVCDMAITPAGKVARYEFYAGGVPFACAPDLHRASWEMISEGQGERRTCRRCYEVYKALLAGARAAAARSTSRSVETKMVFDAHGKIVRIVPEPRNEAHRLIEECMLAANVCAGDFLAARGHPVLYRVHDVPAPEKVEALRDFLAELGLHAARRRQAHAEGLRAAAGEDPGRGPTSRCCRRSCCAR